MTGPDEIQRSPYRIVETEAVERREFPDDKLELEWREIGPVLGLEEMRLNLWYFEEPGDEIGYHAHSKQEEVFFPLQGRFSVKIGRSGETEVVEVEPGTVWTAEPAVGRGTRFLGADDGEEGILLVVSAPNEDDPGLNPHELDGFED